MIFGFTYVRCCVTDRFTLWDNILDGLVFTKWEGTQIDNAIGVVEGRQQGTGRRKMKMLVGSRKRGRMREVAVAVAGQVANTIPRDELPPIGPSEIPQADLPTKNRSVGKDI